MGCLAHFASVNQGSQHRPSHCLGSSNDGGGLVSPFDGQGAACTEDIGGGLKDGWDTGTVGELFCLLTCFLLTTVFVIGHVEGREQGSMAGLVGPCVCSHDMAAFIGMGKCLNRSLLTVDLFPGCSVVRDILGGCALMAGRKAALDWPGVLADAFG